MGFSTIAIHAGNEPDIATGAVSVPTYQTSTYAQDALGKHKGYEYARSQNPTRSALELVDTTDVANFEQAFKPNTKMVFAETPTNPGMSVSVSHPQHELAKRQPKGVGGMVAFETGSLDNAKKVLESVKLCIPGESLGGVESRISHPATMPQASVPIEKREQLRITDGLLRISVGIEDVEDIIADLDQALS
jgi:cystathionine beta-lyase/cystathionine gamma-synthase